MGFTGHVVLLLANSPGNGKGKALRVFQVIKVSRGIKFSFTFTFLVKIISSSTLESMWCLPMLSYICFSNFSRVCSKVMAICQSSLFSRLERITGNLRVVFTFSSLSSLRGLCWKHTSLKITFFFGWLMILEPKFFDWLMIFLVSSNTYHQRALSIEALLHATS